MFEGNRKELWSGSPAPRFASRLPHPLVRKWHSRMGAGPASVKYCHCGYPSTLGTTQVAVARWVEKQASIPQNTTCHRRDDYWYGQWPSWVSKSMCQVKEAPKIGACIPFVVPFIQNSKRCKVTSSDSGGGWELDRRITKVHKEILWGDEYIHYVGLGDGFMGIDMHQNSSHCTFSLCTVYCMLHISKAVFTKAVYVPSSRGI